MCTVNIVKNVSLLSTLLNISVTTESDDIFPSVVCNSCYITVRKMIPTYRHPQYINLHGKHTMISVKYAWRLVGIPVVGRLKRKRRPKDDEPTFQHRKVMERISDLDSPEFANFPFDKCFFLPSLYLDDLSCYNCHCIPNQPIELTTCHHQLCMGCIKVV